MYTAWYHLNSIIKKSTYLNEERDKLQKLDKNISPIHIEHFSQAIIKCTSCYNSTKKTTESEVFSIHLNITVKIFAVYKIIIFFIQSLLESEPHVLGERIETEIKITTIQ